MTALILVDVEGDFVPSDVDRAIEDMRPADVEITTSEYTGVFPPRR